MTVPARNPDHIVQTDAKQKKKKKKKGMKTHLIFMWAVGAIVLFGGLGYMLWLLRVGAGKGSSKREEKRKKEKEEKKKKAKVEKVKMKEKKSEPPPPLEEFV